MITMPPESFIIVLSGNNSTKNLLHHAYKDHYIYHTPFFVAERPNEDIFLLHTHILES